MDCLGDCSQNVSSFKTLVHTNNLFYFIGLEMKSKQASHNKRPKSPKEQSRHSHLMKNQEHPFQPQFSSIKKDNEESKQSLKSKIAASKVKHGGKEMEMQRMKSQQGSFGNNFPSDQIATPQPAFPLPNMFPPPQMTPTPMQQPPFYPPQPVPSQPMPLNPNPLNFPPQPMGLAANPLNGPPQPFVPMNPAPQPSMDPVMSAAGQNFFQQLGGFNAYYYNALDPTLAQKKNVPIAVPASKHWPVLAGTILFIAAIIVMIVGMGKFLQTSTAFGVLGGGIIIYLILSIACSSIRKYIFNLKKFADFESLYNRMRKSRAYFSFFIECYHYKTTKTRTKRGTSSQKHKVVTHTARTEFNPTHVEDDSGEVQALKVLTSYAFVKYLKRFYFVDANSQNRFISAFNHFVSSNRRDTYQNYHYHFQIAGFEEEVGFSHTGEGQHSKVLFILFAILGLAYPYSMWFQNNVSRFQINLLKKLTV